MSFKALSSKPLVEEGLELLLRRIDREIVRVEARLQLLARRLGVESWREALERLRAQGLDNPEADMLWPELLYLVDRLEELKKHRQEVLRELGRVGD